MVIQTYGVIWLAIGATRIYDCISGNNSEAAADETIKSKEYSHK